MRLRPHSLAPRWNELDEAVTLLIPIGSCEQHGPHLPLDTDTQIALEIAHRAAAHIDNCLVAPPITISASESTKGFREHCRSEMKRSLSVLSSSVARLIGHAVSFSSMARRKCWRNYRSLQGACGEGRPALDWWPTGSNTDLHAGRIETSVMLLIDPDQVNTASMATGPTLRMQHCGTRGARTFPDGCSRGSTRCDRRRRRRMVNEVDNRPRCCHQARRTLKFSLDTTTHLTPGGGRRLTTEHPQVVTSWRNNDQQDHRGRRC